MRVAMRSSFVALVPAFGLCLSRLVQNPIEPRQNGGSQDESESICITYVTTYLATLEPGKATLAQGGGPSLSAGK